MDTTLLLMVKGHSSVTIIKNIIPIIIINITTTFRINLEDTTMIAIIAEIPGMAKVLILSRATDTNTVQDMANLIKVIIADQVHSIIIITAMKSIFPLARKRTCITDAEVVVTLEEAIIMITITVITLLLMRCLLKMKGPLSAQLIPRRLEELPYPTWQVSIES